MRIDQYLHAEGLAPSRERAKSFVMAGIVYINDVKAEKPGETVPPNAIVEVRGNTLPYVSRGGLKLEKALRVFPCTPQGKICMDVGASTGGFTDCMLQNGAQKVYSVDVGYGQLAWSLRNDARVVVMERCNIRHVDPDSIPEKIEYFSIDVSFISVKYVFPVLASLTAEGAEGVCLVKPQFEAGREHVGKKGVVRDPAVHAQTIRQASAYAAENGFSSAGVSFSPIKGPEGNIEFLLYLKKECPAVPLEVEMADDIAQNAQEGLHGVSE